MRSKKKTDAEWIIKVSSNAGSNSPRDADENESEYQQVGKKFVRTFFINDLLEQVEGKTISSPLVINITELIDDEFLSHHTESLHAVLAECLVHLFNTNRIVVRSEE